MAMEMRRSLEWEWQWDGEGGRGVCTAVYTRWYGRTTTSAGWSHAVAAVASIHHSLRLFATVPTRSLTRKLVCSMTSFRFETAK